MSGCTELANTEENPLVIEARDEDSDQRISIRDAKESHNQSPEMQMLYNAIHADLGGMNFTENPATNRSTNRSFL